VLEGVRAVLAATVDRRAAVLQAQGLVEDTHPELPLETRWQTVAVATDADAIVITPPLHPTPAPLYNSFVIIRTK
jgi:hypothetical protein